MPDILPQLQFRHPTTPPPQRLQASVMYWHCARVPPFMFDLLHSKFQEPCTHLPQANPPFGLSVSPWSMVAPKSVRLLFSGCKLGQVNWAPCGGREVSLQGTLCSRAWATRVQTSWAPQIVGWISLPIWVTGKLGS